MPDGTEAPPWSWDLRGSSAPALVQVRRWASRTLTEVDDVHLGDVLMVVTELVTNAYDHGQGPLEVRMDYRRTPCLVHIEVDDSCPDHPVVAAPGHTTPGGRGMLIVEKLAVGWGVRDRPGTGGKTVWADVACDGPEAQPDAQT
ncbi:ATP-binding protein [Amycolatopsis sp. cmx-4-61]|uniref:ATP-binding protein n=1 Tax=Amycolatopsis sp. cmx-4-61 TaxID=2790937 RepID=UPI00397ADE40